MGIRRHLLIPLGTAAGPQIHRSVAEVYYVMTGSGTVIVGSETAAIQEGNAIPVQIKISRTGFRIPGPRH